MSSSTVPLLILRVATEALDGYRKFLEMRRKIRAERIRMKQEQEMMQKKFWDDMFLYGGSSTVVVVGCFLLTLFLGTHGN
jgi:hypothetical protein